MEFLFNFFSWFKALPGSGKASFFLVIVGAVVAVILLQSTVKYSGHQYLFTNLSLTDANAIAERLQSMGVDVKLQGDAILVPGQKVLELRNTLASEGLPRGGGTGFEIFDKKSFGATEFEQRINYIRAVQGELSRTISAIDGIEKTRVHIVMPEKTLFKEDREDPRASVALTLFKGRKLSDSQVRGIVHLMITSVEGLTESNINVVDQNGNTLFQATGNDASSLTAKHWDLKKLTEARLERRVIEMLERVVGPGGVSVSISADMNFAQTEKTIESFDPEGRVVLSESLVKDNTSGSSGSASGAPGAASNLPGGAGAGAGSRSENSKREESTATYAVSKTIQRVLDPVGTLNKLSVAVLVDGVYAQAEDGAENYTPRSAEELTKITELVRSAVGFDEGRGDELKVENLQFKRMPVGDATQDQLVEATNSARWMMFLMDNMKVVGIALVLGIIFFLLVKLVNSYSPPVNVAYANLIGQSAGNLAKALPPAASVNIIERDNEAAQQKAGELAETVAKVNLRKDSEDPNAKKAGGSIELELPESSEENLRLQAVKLKTEEVISANVDDAVKLVRQWMSEG